MKKHDLPAMPFYFGDWKKCPEVQALSLSDRMIWFEMLGFMWESTERGYLTINGKPIPEDCLARMIGIDQLTLQKALENMRNFNVFSVRKTDNSIYCRRMIRDEEVRKSKSYAGKVGMKKRYNKNLTGVITESITDTEDENENENEVKDKKEKKKKQYKLELTEPIYNYYMQNIDPVHRTKGRALQNISRWIKEGWTKERLILTIDNYKNTMSKDRQYRKDPANFFGIEDKTFMGYEKELQQPEHNKYKEYDV